MPRRGFCLLWWWLSPRPSFYSSTNVTKRARTGQPDSGHTREVLSVRLIRLCQTGQIRRCPDKVSALRDFVCPRAAALSHPRAVWCAASAKGSRHPHAANRCLIEHVDRLRPVSPLLLTVITVRIRLRFIFKIGPPHVGKTLRAFPSSRSRMPRATLAVYDAGAFPQGYNHETRQCPRCGKRALGLRPTPRAGLGWEP